MTRIRTAEAASPALALLGAERPYGPLAAELALFGQFVGSWDVESVEWAQDGTRRERACEWHFAWVLGGRGVQDVLFERGATPDRRGTTLRAYDERAALWHVTWMGPAAGQFVHLVARATQDGILLEGAGGDGALERWAFSEITPDAFLWRGQTSLDGGETWFLQQEMRVRRRRSAGSR